MESSRNEGEKTSLPDRTYEIDGWKVEVFLDAKGSTLKERFRQYLEAQALWERFQQGRGEPHP